MIQAEIPQLGFVKSRTDGAYAGHASVSNHLAEPFWFDNARIIVQEQYEFCVDRSRSHVVHMSKGETVLGRRNADHPVAA